MDREGDIARILELQGHLMRISMRDHSRTMVEGHLTPTQFHLLVLLHGERGLPTTEAADALGLKPNIASGVVQRLVDRGWVSRCGSPDDGRVRLLSLTEAGVTLVDQAIAEAERGFVQHLSALSTTQVQQLAGIMATIVGALDGDSES